MRLDKRCTLLIKSKEKPRYDAESGRMVGTETTQEVVPCNIGPISARLQNLLGDKLKEATLVVRVRNCNKKVDSLLIDGRPFYIVSEPNHSNGFTAFYVSEVKNG